MRFINSNGVGKGRHSYKYKNSVKVVTIILYMYAWLISSVVFTSAMYRVLGNVSNEINCGLKLETGNK